MSKISLTTVGSLIEASTAATVINNNFSAIQTAFDNTYSRDGTSPNTLTSTLDINSHQVLNLPQPATANSPLRLRDLNSFIGGGIVTNIPQGGTIHQALGKNSGADYDVTWLSIPALIGNVFDLTGITVTGGTFTGSTLTSPAITTPAITNATFTGAGNSLTVTGKGLFTSSGGIVQLGVPNASRLQIVDANNSSPITVDQPTVLASRTEVLSSPGSIANAAIYATSVGLLGNVPQTTALNGYAYQLGTGDALGVGGKAEIHTVAGSTKAAIGLAGEARAYVTGSSAQGMEIQVHNESGNNAGYSSNMVGLQNFIGIDINYYSPAGLKGTAGVMVRSDTGRFDVGYAVNRFAGFSPVVTADFQTDSDSVTVLLAKSGAHTNGIDLTGTGSTYSGSAFKSPGFSVSGTGAIVATSATFAGTTTLPTPFTLGGISVTTTGTQLNYLNAASGTTGTGNVVFATSPILTTPNLGTPTTLVLTSATGLPVSTGISGLATGVATFLATPTSANLAAAVTNETGTGALVFGTSPAITTPTGIVKGDVGLGNVDNTSDTTKWAATKTLTNTTYDTAGAGNSFSINGVAATANTGTGSVVRATSPTLVTPTLGVAAATTVNKVTLTTPATGSTLTVADGKTFASSNTLTLTGTDGSTINLGTGVVVTVKKQIFTASGTYTPSTGMLYCLVEAVGAGGGGGGSSSSGGNGSAGSGGGGGSYANLLATAATIGASKAITIGAAGTAGAAAAGNGGAGGDTSLTTLCIGKGGSGGIGNAGNAAALGGAGGVSGTGDFKIPGQSGATALGYGIVTIFSPPIGVGGNSGKGFGMGGAAGTAGVAGGDGTGYGAGGGGGSSFNGGASAAGGAGAPGVIYITEYCTQ